MDTLPRRITRDFFISRDGYSQAKQRWAGVCRSGMPLHAGHYLFYHLIRGRDYRKAFATPSGAWAAKRLLRRRYQEVEAVFEAIVVPGVSWLLLQLMDLGGPSAYITPVDGCSPG